MKTITNSARILILLLLLFCETSLHSKTVRSLEHQKVAQIRLQTDTSLMLQGTKHDIGLIVYTEDNQMFATTGMQKGKLRWKNFKIEAIGATVKNGKLEISKTTQHEYSSFIPITFSSVYEPEKIFRDTVWLNYETHFELFPTNRFAYIPGTTIELGMRIFYDNHSFKSYRSFNHIPDFEKNYEVLVRSASYRKSKITVFANPLDIPKHKAGVIVELKRDYDIFGVFEVEMNYIAKYKLYATGTSGMFGSSGFSGNSGSTGGNGQHGEDGQFGQHGENGHDLDIFVDAYHDSILDKMLLKVYVEDLYTLKSNHYLINPDGGSLQIYAQGGDGGHGGDGGRGGNGGNGNNGEYYQEQIKEIVITKDTAGKEIKTEVIRTITRQRRGEDGGHGGDGGWGGHGGSGGNGGYIFLNHTTAAKPYLGLLKINAWGGSGGRGGTRGNSGDGGKGGSGNPNGRNGRNGVSGNDGQYGYSGSSGRVEYRLVNQIPWD